MRQRSLSLSVSPSPFFSLHGYLFLTTRLSSSDTHFAGLLQDSASGAYFVELLYDRKPVTMSGCVSPCPWAQFVAIASKNFVTDRAAACQPQMRKRVVLMDPVAEFLC